MPAPLVRTLLLVASLLAVAAPAPAQARSANDNRTDAAFASMMLPHHLGGVQLGQLAADKGADADIRRLGRGIVRAQTAEAKTLRQMVRRFGTKASMPPEIERRDRMDLAELRAASGTTFDRMWLKVISAHHMSAIQMAQMEQRGGRNAAARRLAARIVKAQRRELSEFNALSERLG